jgi:diguanylate cyclase (GGDEF)-like protein
VAISTPYIPTWDRRTSRSVLIVVLGAVVWVAASTLGHLTSSTTGGHAAIYLPAALLVGFMIRIPKHRPQLSLAALFGNLGLHLASGNSLVVPALSTTATLAEALILSTVMCSTGAAAFRKTRDGLIFGITALAACVVGALLGAAIYAATGSGPALHKFATWVPADLLGILLVTPLIVTARPQRADARRIAGFFGLLLLASALALLAATRSEAALWSTFLSWYFVLLVLLLVGTRYGVAALGLVQAVPAILVFIAVADTSPTQWFERQVLAIALSWSLLVAVLAIRAELRSRHSLEQLTVDLFHHSPSPTAVARVREGRLTITHANAAWHALPPQEDLLQVLAPEDAHSLATPLPLNGAHTAELRTPDGRVLDVTINTILGAGEDQDYLISVADLTAHRVREATLRHAATTDPLTGLANRRAVFEELERRAGNPGTAVLYLDLNGFKDVNDTYGHSVGDAVLAEVSRLLMAGFRSEDTVARIGGDEFIVIAELGGHADLAALCQRAERLVTSDLDSVQIRASVGGVTVNLGERPEQTLARADAAMYRRKLQQRRS